MFKNIKMVLNKESNWLQQLALSLQQAVGEPPTATLAPGTSKEAIPGLIKKASAQTASISATLALPGGFTGLLTMAPEIYSIWRIQAQLIANIAYIHGKASLVTREQMLWCMFRQVGYGVVKEFVFQRGSVFVVKKMQDATFQQALQKLGLAMLSKQSVRFAGKIIPLLGSVSAGTLSYYDTKRTAVRAMKLYSSPMINEPEDVSENWFV